MTLQDRLKRAESGRQILYKGADGSVTYRGDNGRPLPAVQSMSLEDQRQAERLGEQEREAEALDTWWNDYSQFAAQSRKDSAARDGVWQDASTFEDYRKRQTESLARLQEQAEKSRYYYNTHRYVFGSDQVDKILSQIDKGREGLQGIGDALSAEGEYRGQFLDQYEYDTYQRLSGADAEELKRWNQELEQETRDLQHHKLGSREETKQALEQIRQTQNRVLSRYYELDNQEKLAALEKDQTAKSLYTQADAGTFDADTLLRRMLDRLDRGGSPEEDPAAAERIAELYGIDPVSSGSIAQYMNDLTAALGTEPEGGDKQAEAIRSLAGMGYDYNRLARYKKTQEDAKRFAEEQERIRQTAQEHPVLSSGLSVLAAPFQGLDYLDAAARALSPAGDPKDIERYEPLNAYNMGATNLVSGIRGAVAEQIEEQTPGMELFGHNVPSFLYQTGMSMADSAAQVGLLGPASLPVMGGAAAANQAQDIIARGGNNTQVLLGGAAAGAAEMLFEKFSVEQLLAPKSVTGWKSMLKETAKQAGTEASEEMFTEIANILSDAAIMGRDSASELAVREYMRQGKSEEEARQQVFFDHIGQVVEAGVGGALSGAGMGGVTSAVNWALGGGRYGSMEAMQYQNRTDPLVQAAREMHMDGPQEAAQAVSTQAVQNTTPEAQAAQESAQNSPRPFGPPPSERGATEGQGTDGAAAGNPQSASQTAPFSRGPQSPAPSGGTAMERAAEVFGENGRKAFAAAWDGEGDSARYYAGFAAWYQAGLEGKAESQVRSPYAGAVSEAQRLAAYNSGQRDAAVSLAKEKAAVLFAKTAGTEAGLVYDEYVAEAVERNPQSASQTAPFSRGPQSPVTFGATPFQKGAEGQGSGTLTAETAGRINTVAKALGVRVRFVDSVDGGRANAQISGSEILVERNNPNPVMTIVGHELTHRVQELSPESYRAFREAAVAELADSAVQAKLDAYRAQGENILYEQAMDEAAADYAGRLMEETQVLDRFIERHRTDRTLLEKVRDAFRHLVDKLTGAERRRAQTAEGRLTAALDAAAEGAGTINPQSASQTAPFSRGPLGADGKTRYSLKEYDGKDLAKDGSVYTYDFLTSLPDMKVTALPEVDAVRDSSGKVDARSVVDLGMKNARAVGTERDGKVFVRNSYTGKQLQVTAESIRHGLNGGLNRLLTNARLGSMIGDLVQNAVPINALQDKAQGVTGTYAMAGYATDSAGREFVAILTVEQRTGRVVDVEAYDMLHAVSGRQKRSERVDTKSQGLYPSTNASEISIADFLEAVKGTHQSILPQDVLDRFGEERNPGGYYTGKAQYSLKGTTITRTYDQLLRENDALRERLDYWRGQTRTTKAVTTDRKSVTAAAKALVQEYGAKLDAGALAERLQGLYDAMASGKDGQNELGPTDAWQRAEAIARDLADAAVEEWSLNTEFPGLREKLRDTSITIGHEYDGDIRNENFRRDYRGRLKLSSQGTTNVDTVYAELAESYPGLFPQDITHPADQLEQIMEVADSLSAVSAQNPFSGHMEEAVTGITNEIMEGFFDLPQTRATFADRQAEKLEGAVAHGKQRVAETREQYKARMDALRRENRQAVQNAIARERTAREKQVAELKNQYKARTEAGRERQRAGELRGKITRHAKTLSDKLLRPTDKAHISEELRGPVAKVLESINLEGQYTVDPETGRRTKGGEGGPTKRTQAFLELKQKYAEIAKQGGDLVIDPSLLGSDAEGVQGGFDAVIAMGDTRLADMNTGQLSTVWQVLKAVEHSVSTAGKLLNQGKYQRTAEWADALDRDTGTRRNRRPLTRNHASLDLENPYTFFSHFGESGKAIYRTLRDAQDRQQVLTNRVAEAAGKVVDEKAAKKLEKTTHDFTTEGGDKLTLSTAQVMELRELSRRKQAREHLLVGGIVQPEIRGTKVRRGTDAIRLTANDLAAITGTLTAEEVQIADGLQQLTSTLLADMGNEASMTAYGYRKFTETDYWPIRSAREGLHSSIEKGGDNARSIKNTGMAQATVPHANNQVDLGSIFDTFARHTGDMVDYAAWLCPMEDLNRVYNFRYRDGAGNQTGATVKGLLDRVGGTGSQKYWQDLMEDIQNGIKARSDSPIGAIASKGIGAFKGAAVGGNIRVIIQQPTAFFRAGAVLSPADMALGLTKGATRGNGWKKALQYSPIAMRKDAGGFDISSPGTMKETLFGKTGAVDKLNDALSWGAGKADAVTWGRLWNACEWQVARTHKDLAKGSESFYAEVNRVFTDMVDQTQVVDGILQRANIMRSSNAMVQQATSFMGEPLMSLNLTMRAWDQLRNEQDPKKRGKAIRNLGRTATALVVTSAVNAVAQSVVDAMRDDDKDKKYWERFQTAFTGLEGDEESLWDRAWAVVMEGNLGGGLNPMDQIPYVKDVLSLMQGYDVSRTELSVVQDLIEAGQTFARSADGTGPRTRAYAAKELFSAGSKLFGIPVANLTRDTWALLRSVATETDNLPLQYEMEKAIYNVGSEKNKSRFSDILYRALERGELETYQHIRDELMDQMGLDGAALDSAMKSRYQTRLKKNPDYSLDQRARDLLGIRSKLTESEKEETFGPDDLDTASYQSFAAQRADRWRAAAAKLEGNALFGKLSDAEKDKAMDAAWTYANQTALAEASGGQYKPTVEWIGKAQEAAKRGVQPWEYVLYNTAYSTDAAYKALERGSLSEYKTLRGKYMDVLGKSGTSVDSSMRGKYEDKLKENPRYTLPQAALDLIGIHPSGSSGEDSFDAGDLNRVAYDAYTAQRAADYRETVDSLEAMPSFRDMDQETRDKLVSMAYTMAHQTALADNSNGQYSPSYKWVQNTLDAQEEADIEPGEFLLWNTAYNMAFSDKDANGKVIKGREKKDKVRAWLLEQEDLTPEQRAYLWGTEYKSAW